MVVRRSYRARLNSFVVNATGWKNPDLFHKILLSEQNFVKKIKQYLAAAGEDSLASNHMAGLNTHCVIPLAQKSEQSALHLEIIRLPC